MLRRMSPVLFTASDSSEEKRIVDKAISKSMLLCYLCINYNHRDFGVLVYNFAYELFLTSMRAFTVIL